MAGERTARGWHGWQQRSTRLRRRGSGDTPMSFVIAGNDGGGEYRNLGFVKSLSENLKKKCTATLEGCEAQVNGLALRGDLLAARRGRAPGARLRPAAPGAAGRTRAGGGMD